MTDKPQAISAPIAGTLLRPNEFANRLWYEHEMGVNIAYFEGIDELIQAINIGKIQSLIVSREFAQLKTLPKIKAKIVLIHLSDEAYDIKTYIWLYKCDWVKQVIRNYFAPKMQDWKNALIVFISCWIEYIKRYKTIAKVFQIRNKRPVRQVILDFRLSVSMLFRQMRCSRGLAQCKKISTACVPLGVTNKFWNAKERLQVPILGIMQRDLIWSFAGCLNSTARAQMLGELEGFGPSVVRLFQDWGQTSPEALSGDEYFALLNRTRFVPCPMGWFNVESFRWVEGIEAGAIPVLVRRSICQPFDCFAYLGENPLPIFDGWRAATRWMKDNAESESLERLCAQIGEWYQGYKAQVARLLTGHVRLRY